MCDRFDGKVAIITGSGRGIGREVALGVARGKGKVVVHDRDKEPAEEVAAEINKNGGEAIAIVGDVSNQDDVARLFSEGIGKFGKLDIVVNNAGVINTALIHKMTEEEWDYVVDINMKGVFFCLQEAGRYFIKRAKENPDAPRIGSVVNVSSVAGLRGTVGQINYGAAKSGVIGMTMSAAREWGRHRINVNAVAFGVMETRLTEVVRTDERFKDTYLKQIALGRYGTPKDAAGPILFLVSEEAGYMTGETLNVSGGMHIGF